MTGLVQDAAPAIAPDVKTEVLLELEDLVVEIGRASCRERVL